MSRDGNDAPLELTWLPPGRLAIQERNITTDTTSRPAIRIASVLFHGAPGPRPDTMSRFH
jgi:hypothetical protein